MVMLVALYMTLAASHRMALLWLPATLLSCDEPPPALPRTPLTGPEP
jgi:hypothetical protein